MRLHAAASAAVLLIMALALVHHQTSAFFISEAKQIGQHLARVKEQHLRTMKELKL
jgi:hypothetical protein